MTALVVGATGAPMNGVNSAPPVLPFAAGIRVFAIEASLANPLLTA